MKHQYTVEELLDKVQFAQREELISMWNVFLRMKHDDATRSRIEKVISEGAAHEYANISLDRSISAGALKELSVHPIMQYVEPILKAAMSVDGPFQSRDILVNSTRFISDHTPYYMKRDLNHQDKKFAGYILSMAGLERRSHYDRDRKMPVKAWKPMRGVMQITVKQRVNMVFNIMAPHMQKSLSQQPAIDSIGGLI